MSELGYTPKFMLMANRIREEILSGKFAAGEWLKSDNELSEEFGINKRTVANGMAQLVREGLIRREPKRGTIVLRAPVREEKRSRAVGIIAESYGHLYSDMKDVINDSLIERGLYPVWIEHKVFQESVIHMERKNVISLLEHIIADRPYGFIINADRCVSMDFIRENSAKMGRIVYMFDDRQKRSLPGTYVVTDFRRIGRIMAEHLAGAGHRRLGYFSMPVNKKIYDSAFPTGHEETARAMADFCRENGLVFVEESAERCFKGENVLRILSDLHARGVLPTGAGLHSDSFAKSRLYPAAAKLGLSIPEDLSVIGVGDTPWTERILPNLTSVSYNHLEIARQSVVQLTAETPRNWIVEPLLIKRDSVAQPRKGL